MLDGANKKEGKVLNKADVGTLNPGINAPVDAIAVGGIVPGENTYDGNVLKSAAVGTLTSPEAFATRVPP